MCLKNCKLRCKAENSKSSLPIEIYFLLDNEEHSCLLDYRRSKTKFCAAQVRRMEVVVRKYFPAAALQIVAGSEPKEKYKDTNDCCDSYESAGTLLSAVVTTVVKTAAKTVAGAVERPGSKARLWTRINMKSMRITSVPSVM